MTNVRGDVVKLRVFVRSAVYNPSKYSFKTKTSEKCSGVRS